MLLLCRSVAGCRKVWGSDRSNSLRLTSWVLSNFLRLPKSVVRIAAGFVLGGIMGPATFAGVELGNDMLQQTASKGPSPCMNKYF